MRRILVKGDAIGIGVDIKLVIVYPAINLGLGIIGAENILFVFRVDVGGEMFGALDRGNSSIRCEATSCASLRKDFLEATKLCAPICS